MDNCLVRGILLTLTFCGFCFRSSLSLRMSAITNSFLLSWDNRRNLLLLVETQVLGNSP